ncbi:YbaK/EbsC family protein [Paraburkholderia sp. SIMBA_054]|jgi:prolyl-tRNA editing enzyme YbaK/EbsC (Cys-tRNA(Pro) deacylase)|uniref:YbaK/EbsC family protein n=1 Tax=Paraburkholderia TaxID=1822464 RepID=UPI0039798968
MLSHEPLQKLDIIAPDSIGAHLPSHVAASIEGRDIVVFSVTDDASDTADFSARYGFPMEDCANTIVVKYKKDGGEHLAAIVTLGSLRLDVNGAVKAALGAKRISFAQRELATEQSAMEFGGITAFGLPTNWRVLVDAGVMERGQVVMGAGIRKAKLLLAPSVLEQLDNVEVAQLTLPPDAPAAA